jgi:hypothetical protein
LEGTLNNNNKKKKYTTPRHIGETHMCEPHPNVPWSCALVVHVSLPSNKKHKK